MDFENYTESFRLKAEEWARANGEAERLEHMRHVILAELFNQMEGPIGEREHKARAHARYHEHILEMTQARTKANVAKGQMEFMRMRFEAWRTVNATRRAEMKL